MSSHQKRILISNVCIYVGLPVSLLGVSLMFVFGFCISDETLSGKLIFSAIIIMVLGLICVLIATRISAKYAIYSGYIRSKFGPPLREYFASAGVPNNHFSEFDIPISKSLPEVLQALEISKGVYEINFDKKNYTFDMQGWIFKEYYIYEIILTKIQTKFISKRNMKSLCKSLHINEIRNLELKFIRLNGKKKMYSLVENGETRLSHRFKKNMRQKIIYYKNLKSVSIKSLYDFNE